MKRFLKRINWKKIIKILIIIAIIIAAAGFSLNYFVFSKFKKMDTENKVTTAKVETRDIQNVLSSSGTISPLHTYEVTTLVEGEVIAADFEEGDIVEEGQVLYQIDTDNLDNQMDNGKTSLDRAKKNLSKAEDSYRDAQEKLSEAQADYDEAKVKYGNANIKATESGMIKTLYIEEGQTIQKGAQIAEIYDNSTMLLNIPFSAAEVDQSYVGKTAKVTIDSTNETITGKVTNVSNIDEVLSGNRVVNQVTIQVNNPGGITTSTVATASIGSIYSSDEGTFSVKTQKVITSEVNGEISSLKVKVGSKVKEGDILFTLTAGSVEDLMESYKSKLDSAQDAVEAARDNVDNAKDAIEDAESKLQDVIDTRTDYSITAPTTGKIVKKDALAGDTIKNTSQLCTIYDLSAVTFEMAVDELDVMSVKVGQKVNVTADAFEDESIKGVVTNVSLLSTSNQGVTQYPVTVRIDDVGNLLPGMNVTGEIIIEKAEGVMAIPADALMRGDKVYVKDDSVKEVNGDVPAGFKAVEVETGLTDGDYIEIKSGLTGNEEVYVKRISQTVNMMMPGMSFDMQRQGGPMQGGQRQSGNRSGGGQRTQGSRR
jgi:HlyD family secretion protein